MDLSKFKDLPDHARVWIHGFKHELNERDQEIIQHKLVRFLPEWVSHGVPVKASLRRPFCSLRCNRRPLPWECLRLLGR